MNDDPKTDDELTPQQKAAKTRAENKAKAEAEEAAKDQAKSPQAVKAAEAEDPQRDPASKAAQEATPTDTGPEAEGATITVICAVAGGRRRGGRAWPGGATTIEADDVTPDELEALEADPLFVVHGCEN